MFQPKRVPVDDNPAVLVVEGKEGSEALICNRDDTDSVYLGESGVTSATGYELAAGESMYVSIGSDDDDLYAICAPGLAATLHVLVH